MRSRAQTIAIILSKYKKRAGVHSSAFEAKESKKAKAQREYEDAARARGAARETYGSGFIAPDGKFHANNETRSGTDRGSGYGLSHRENAVELGFRDVGAALDAGHIRLTTNTFAPAGSADDDVGIEFKDTPATRKLVTDYLKNRRPSGRITMDIKQADGSYISYEYSRIGAALERLNPTSFAAKTAEPKRVWTPRTIPKTNTDYPGMYEDSTLSTSKSFASKTKFKNRLKAIAR